MSISFTHHFEAGADPAAPPILLLHGTGGDENDLVPLGRTLSPGSALLSPRGKVNEHGAARFFARLAEGVFDPAEVARRAHELADFVADSAREYRFDPARVVAVGLSNGANIAAAILLLRPIVLAGAILLRPMVVLDTPAAPHSLDGKRVLIAGGSRDPIVSADHPPRLASYLRAGGAEVALHMSPTGHGLVREDVTVAQAWIARALKSNGSV